MPLFVMLTTVSTEAVRSPQVLEELERKVTDRIRQHCPSVEWIGSYAVLGPFDYVDIFRADNIETATIVATIVRSFGHARTEIWAGTEWNRFKEVIRSIPGEWAGAK